MSDWPTSVAVAARQEPRVAKSALAAWQAGREAVNLHRLEAACRHGDADEAYTALVPDRTAAAVQARLQPLLAAAFLSGAHVGIQPLAALGIPVERERSLPEQLPPLSQRDEKRPPRRPEVAVRMDGVNQLSVFWARAHAAALVVATQEIKAQIRKLVVASQAGGIPPAVLMRQIRDVIGLDPRRMNALERFERGLREQELSEAVVAKRAARYAQALRQQRAWTIARTETIGALAKGQLSLWDQAAAQGFLSRAEFGKVWIATNDDLICDECEELADEVVGLDEEFSSGDDAPPAHSNCRCAIGLAPLEKDKAKRLEDNHRRSSRLAQLRGQRDAAWIAAVYDVPLGLLGLNQ